VVHHFVGALAGAPYPPLDATQRIAEAVREGWLRHRAALGLAG